MASEDAPEEVKARYPGPELIGNRFVLAAEADMELRRGVDLDASGAWSRSTPLGQSKICLYQPSQTVG